MDIINAKVRGMAHVDGRPCAEVEVETNRGDARNVLVYFAQAPDGGIEMVRVVENDARYEIDWYDNPLHQAAVDRTDAFASAAYAGGSGSFAEQVLHFGSVREEMFRMLDQGG